VARFNVQDVAFGAKGDAIKLLDATVASGSNVVTSATAKFVAGDVGKAIWGADPVLHVPVLARTTITARLSATQVTVGVNATANLSGACVVFGTDDTAAFQAMFAAAVAAYRGGSVPGYFEIPSAGYIVSQRWYRNAGTVFAAAGPDVVGDGTNQTQFYLAPDFTVPGDGSTMFMENVGVGINWRGITVDGCYAVFATAPDQSVIRIAQAANFSARDIHIVNLGLGTGSFMWKTDGCRQFHCDNIIAQNSTTVGNGGAMWVEDCGGLYSACFASNTNANIRFVNINGRSTLTTPFTWEGGGSDEGGSPTVALINAIVGMRGIINFNGIDAPAIGFDVDAQSALYIEDSNVGRFLGYGGPATPLKNRGLVVSKGTTWRGNSSLTPAKFMDNKGGGRFVDVGCNEYRRYSADDTFTRVTPFDCFDGPWPIVNGSWGPFSEAPY